VLHYRLLLPGTVRRAALLHCTSHWTRAALCALFPGAAAKARVVHPAVDELFRPPPADAVRRFLEACGFEEPPFLFVGNPEPKKNVLGLLEAFSLLRQRHGSRRKLLMVGGEGWGVRRLQEAMGRLGLGEHVVRLGYVRREELPLVYGSALALVFPSHVEGFGLPPIEAMACGTPVITSGAAGLAESVGTAAVVVKDASARGLAEAMHRLEVSPQERRRLARAGLRRAASFRWHLVVGQMRRLYREAAGR